MNAALRNINDHWSTKERLYDQAKLCVGAYIVSPFHREGSPVQHCVALVEYHLSGLHGHVVRLARQIPQRHLHATDSSGLAAMKTKLFDSSESQFNTAEVGIN